MTKKQTAYALIKRYGWVQGRSGSKREGFCLVGAISNAHPRTRDLEKYFSKVRPIVGQFLADWNDAPGRTKRQVLAALKKAGV